MCAKYVLAGLLLVILTSTPVFCPPPVVATFPYRTAFWLEAVSMRRRLFKNALFKNGPILLALTLSVAALALYVAWPLLFQAQPVENVESDPGWHVSTQTSHPLEVIRERGITCVAGLWFFAFGASIGSFLNVVAYRMPMGLTIVSKPSRCPYCETPIRFKHNVPIFGWIALRARCAACRLPISSRYVLIEIFVGVLFFLLFWRELASGGANLPVEWSSKRSGIMWNVLTPNWPLIGTYFYHGLLIGILATIALMKWDRLKIPVRFVLFALLVPTACKYAWPHLMIWTWWSPAVASLAQTREWEAAIHSLAGGVVGLLVGWALHCLVARRNGFPVIGLIVGTFLGWQCVVPCMLFTVFIQFFMALLGKLLERNAQNLWSFSCLLGTVLMICIWKQMPALGMPNEQSGVLIHWGWLVLSLATAYVATQIRPAAS